MEALGYVTKVGAQPLLLEIIVGVVQLDSAGGLIDPIRAAMLLEFVRKHPACDRMTKERAEITLANLAGKLSNTEMDKAKELGSTLELESLVSEILG
jgi:hypothetical protein